MPAERDLVPAALRFALQTRTGEKKLWPGRIEKCEWMYTEPYREAQNGNPSEYVIRSSCSWFQSHRLILIIGTGRRKDK
jgi:hypothetical protein